MAGPFQTLQILGKPALYHKFIYEVRYEHGLVYLDRCGTTANRIIESDPEWVVREDAVSPQGAPLVHAGSGIQFNFGTQKYDFSLNQPIGKETTLTRADIDLFITKVHAVSAIVHHELELKAFLREGFRVWYLFATESDEDSEKWIASLGAFQVSPSVTAAFAGHLSSETHVVVITARDRKFRAAVTAVERLEILDLGTDALKTLPRSLPKGQREALLTHLRAKLRVVSNPQFAVMVDVDAFVENPIEIEPADFIRQSLEEIETALPKAFPGGTE